MSRIWDALQQIEQQRRDNALEFIVPGRIQLTPKQQIAVQALLRTDSLAEAARLTGVAEMTMRRWLTRPGFITAYYQAGREQLERERVRLDAAADNTLEKLRRAREMLSRLAELTGELRRAEPRLGRGNGAGEAANGAPHPSRDAEVPPQGEDETAGGR